MSFGCGAARPRRRGRGKAALAVSAACLLVTTACGSTARPTPPSQTKVSFPDTPAGAQARWLLGAVAHLPIATADVTAHFDQAFLAKNPPADLNTIFEALSGFVLDSVAASSPDTVVVVITASRTTKVEVSVSVDAHGLISGLRFQPVGASPPASSPLPPAPSAWAGVEADVRSVAPTVRFLAASLNGDTCQSIEAINTTIPAPLASSFKLYVLDALATAIASGQVSWDQELTITSEVKSGGSGTLQDEPVGTPVSVEHVASLMISISDNTAADMLIGLLGPGAVEQAAKASGMADPALDTPFLTTRQQFTLDLYDWPKLAQRYLALKPPQRARFLTSTVDGLTPSDQSPWTTPRDINSIGWFASPSDMCHVFASLAALARQPKLAPLATILDLPGQLGLSPSQWQSVWYKGGSDPGVLTLNYLAMTRSGKTYVVSVLAENPTAPISSSADTTLNQAIKGALTLVAAE
jgi:beta-lactamase class A